MRAFSPNSFLWPTLIFVGVVLALVVLLAPMLTPFVLAAVLAYVFDPLADWLEARGLSRTLATGLLVIGLLLVVSGLILLVVPLFIDQGNELASRLPGYFDALQTRLLPWLEHLLGVSIALDVASLKAWLASHAQSAGTLAGKLLPGLSSGASYLLSLLINLVLVPVVMFYLLRDWDRFMARLDALVPRRLHAKVNEILSEVDAVLSEFLRGQMAVMAVMSVYYALALSFLGLDFAVPIGLITGILGFIPFVGATIGLLLGTVEALLQFPSLLDVAAVIAVFLVGQMIEGYVVVPRLVGDRVGLHPVAIIFALAAFGQLFGFFGVLAAVPLSAALLVAARHARQYYLASPLYASNYNPSLSPPTMTSALAEPAISSLPLVSRGKVRNLYAIDAQHLLLVASDRLSAFDVILPTPIPGKGEVLTAVTQLWFARLGHILPNQLTGIDPESVVSAEERTQVRGRALVVKRLKPLPVEAIVRGYLAGSGWKEYQATGSVCGIALPAGLRLADRLPAPLFTPSTKAALGEHDENIDFATCETLLGAALAQQVRDASLALYAAAAAYALTRGLIIADTKFEFGLDEHGVLHLIDEVLTPDSSRFWPADQYQPGVNPPSFDKQFVRDWLESSGWDKTPPAPALPADVLQKTAEKYREAWQRLAG
jgi:phosphoribosylaminoimidazole-succinocarboxamide synthase